MIINFVKLYERWRFDPYSDPPLGMLSVIAAVRNAGEKVIFTDMAHEKELPDADVYALSACTLDYPELIKIAKQVKEKGKPVIVGGPHFDAIDEQSWWKDLPNLPIDIICRGEGEVTALQALNRIRNGNTEKTIINQTPPFSNLDTLPLPAFDILDKAKYFKPGKAFAGGGTFSRGNSATMMTSRGCPYLCSFCASPLLHHKRVRYRGIDHVKKELLLLKNDYNVSEIRFQDDCFTVNEKRFLAICDLLKSEQINYRCSMRVDQVDDVTLKRLWDSGCREIGFGIESAEDHVLKLLYKKTSVELNKYALKKTKEYGFFVRAFMMTGLPGETKDSAENMVKFLEESDPDVVTLTSFMPLPGSDIYINPAKYGVTILDTNWEHYDISLKWQSHVPFVHKISTATTEEMERNREILKNYIFNRKKSNISAYNKEYKAEL